HKKSERQIGNQPSHGLPKGSSPRWTNHRPASILNRHVLRATARFMAPTLHSPRSQGMPILDAYMPIFDLEGYTTTCTNSSSKTPRSGVSEERRHFSNAGLRIAEPGWITAETGRPDHRGWRPAALEWGLAGVDRRFSPSNPGAVRASCERSAHGRARAPGCESLADRT